MERRLTPRDNLRISSSRMPSEEYQTAIYDKEGDFSLTTDKTVDGVSMMYHDEGRTTNSVEVEASDEQSTDIETKHMMVAEARKGMAHGISHVTDNKMWVILFTSGGSYEYIYDNKSVGCPCGIYPVMKRDDSKEQCEYAACKVRETWRDVYIQLMKKKMGAFSCFREEIDELMTSWKRLEGNISIACKGLDGSMDELSAYLKAFCGCCDLDECNKHKLDRLVYNMTKRHELLQQLDHISDIVIESRKNLRVKEYTEAFNQVAESVCQEFRCVRTDMAD